MILKALFLWRSSLMFKNKWIHKITLFMCVCTVIYQNYILFFRVKQHSLQTWAHSHSCQAITLTSCLSPLELGSCVESLLEPCRWYKWNGVKVVKMIRYLILQIIMAVFSLDVFHCMDEGCMFCTRKIMGPQLKTINFVRSFVLYISIYMFTS